MSEFGFTGSGCSCGEPLSKQVYDQLVDRMCREDERKQHEKRRIEQIHKYNEYIEKIKHPLSREDILKAEDTLGMPLMDLM